MMRASFISLREWNFLHTFARRSLRPHPCLAQHLVGEIEAKAGQHRPQQGGVVDNPKHLQVETVLMFARCPALYRRAVGVRGGIPPSWRPGR